MLCADARVTLCLPVRRSTWIWSTITLVVLLLLGGVVVIFWLLCCRSPKPRAWGKYTSLPLEDMNGGTDQDWPPELWEEEDPAEGAGRPSRAETDELL